MPADTTLVLNQPGQQSTPPPQTPPATPPEAPPAAPAAEPAPKGKASPALNALVDAFVSDTRASSKTPPKKEKSKEPEPKTEEPTPPPQPPPAPPKKAAKVATAKPPVAKPEPTPAPTAPLTAEQIAAVAEGAARAIVQKQQTQADEQTPLSEGTQYTLKVLERMETLFPEQYKGITQNYQKQLRELTAYISQWEQEHPGEEFDQEDPEHSEFLAAHDTVDWQDHHFRKAEVRMEAEELVSKERGEVNEKIAALEKAEELRNSVPKIQKDQFDVARQYWDDLGEEFKGLFMENGQIDPNKYQALAQSDPDFDLKVEFATTLHEGTAELFKILYKYVPFNASNRLHSVLDVFVAECEKDQMDLPPEKRVRDGKDYVTLSEYNKLTEEQRKTKWTFTYPDFKEMLGYSFSKKAKDQLAQTDAFFKKRAAKLGLQLPTAPGNRNGTPPEEPAPQPGPTDLKPESPSATSMPRLAASKASSSQPPTKPLDAFAGRFLT